MTDEDVCNRIIVTGPETFVRGLKVTYPVMKKDKPKLAEQCVRLGVEIVGRERARAIWKEKDQLLKSMDDL